MLNIYRPSYCSHLPLVISRTSQNVHQDFLAVISNLKYWSMSLCDEVQKTLDVALLKSIGILGVKEQKYYSISYNSIRRQAKSMGTQYELSIL